MRQNIPLYRVKDELNNPIVGTFYERELVKTLEDLDQTYTIEKVLKTRKYKGINQSFVKWQDFGNQFNSWVNTSDITDL